MVSWETKATSVGVAGSCSASKEASRDSKSAWLSPVRTRVSAVRPWVRPLKRTAARPASVLGPVLFCALRRLASICFRVAIDAPIRLDDSWSVLGWRDSFGVSDCGGWEKIVQFVVNGLWRRYARPQEGMKTGSDTLLVNSQSAGSQAIRPQAESDAGCSAAATGAVGSITRLYCGGNVWLFSEDGWGGVAFEARSNFRTVGNDRYRGEI